MRNAAPVAEFFRKFSFLWMMNRLSSFVKSFPHHLCVFIISIYIMYGRISTFLDGISKFVAQYNMIKYWFYFQTKLQKCTKKGRYLSSLFYELKSKFITKICKKALIINNYYQNSASVSICRITRKKYGKIFIVAIIRSNIEGVGQ